MQVNTLSTILLGLLLLQWMKRIHHNTQMVPHLMFVTSRDHLDPDIRDWSSWATDQGIVRHLSDPQNWSPDHIAPNYANSKLLTTYAVDYIREEALGQDGR